MATYTTFLNLEKPSTSERLDVLKINSNWDKIDAGVSALNSQLANGIVKCGSKTISIPAWSTGNPQSIEVDFTDDIPTGRSLYYVVATIGVTLLPYINNSGVVKTWIRNTTGSNKKIVIYSTDPDGWNNATIYYALILK